MLNATVFSPRRKGEKVQGKKGFVIGEQLARNWEEREDWSPRRE